MTVIAKASARDYLRLLRPQQWAKNLLVTAAPFAAGVLVSGRTVVLVLAGFAAWSLVASGGYAFNDVQDAEADRRHPRKRVRPVATGQIPMAAATGIGGALIAAGLGIAALVAPADFTILLAGYVVMTVAYSWLLKRVALADVAVIAFGFVLRALSGALLVDVPISQWFIIVTGFGALFVAAGKRYGERSELGAMGNDQRAALGDYAPGFLEFLIGVSAAVMLLGYSLWAFEIQDRLKVEWMTLSIAPFALVVLRYSQLVFAGRGGEPELLFFADRTLQGLGIVWVTMLVAGFYAT